MNVSSMQGFGVWYCIFTMVHVSSVTAGNTSCPLCYHYNATQQCERQKDYRSNVHNILRTEGLVLYWKCPFSQKGKRIDRMHSELPCDPDKLNDMMCGPYNRKGLLCGRCIDGYGPPVYSYDLKCADCSKLSTGYAVTLYLFFICVVIFRLNITSGPLLGYVLFCQIFKYMESHVSTFLKFLLHTSVTLSEVWNMKPIIPPFCINEKLTGIHIKVLALVRITHPVVYTCHHYLHSHGTTCKELQNHSHSLEAFQQDQHHNSD